MDPVTVKDPSRAIVYDADALPGADAGLFDPQAWRAAGRLTGTAPGRGSSVFVDSAAGPAVLRRYLRGGWAARFSREHYFHLGCQRSRPFREFHLLARMAGDGLRVPAPLAALCAHSGLASRGALLTRRIAPATPLAGRLDDPGLDWARLGRELRGFFDAGVRHADLNARNILLHDQTGAAWLIDFDRCAYTPGTGVDGQRQLARLRRSLVKLWPASGPGLETCWNALWGGHHAGP